MSVARSSRCLLCLSRRTARQSTPRLSRNIHSTPVRRQEDTPKPKDNIVSISKQGRESQKTPKEEWSEQYNPRQVEAIEAAKQLIGDKFNAGQNVPRTDPWSVDYYDDFQKINPVVDQPIRAPWENLDDELRMRSDDDANVEFQKFLDSLPQEEKDSDEPITLKYLKFLDNMQVTTGREEAERNPPSALAPTIPSPPKAPATTKIAGRAKQKAGEGESDRKRENESSPEFVRLMQMTGYNAKQLAGLRVKSIISHRVSNQTRLGKIHKVYFLSIAGNENGLLGIGEGKAEDMTSARLQSQYRAIRSMQPIKRYENRTIFGTVNGKVAATELELYARPPGMPILSS